MKKLSVAFILLCLLASCAAPTPLPTASLIPTQTVAPEYTPTSAPSSTPTAAEPTEPAPVQLVDETKYIYRGSPEQGIPDPTEMFDGEWRGIKMKVVHEIHESVTDSGPVIRNIQMNKEEWAESTMKVLYDVKQSQDYTKDYETWLSEMQMAQNEADSEAADATIWVNDLETAGFAENLEVLRFFGAEEVGKRVINEVHIMAVKADDESVANIKITSPVFKNGWSAHVIGDKLYIYVGLGYHGLAGANDVEDLSLKYMGIASFLKANKGQNLDNNQLSVNQALEKWLRARMMVTPPKK